MELPKLTPFLYAVGLLLLLNLPAPAAEDQALENLTGERNLSSLPFRKIAPFSQAAVGRIHVITQGPEGFMWIGTQQGLFRYDGRRIKKFQHEKGNPNSLADDTVWSLHLDLDHRLWVGTRHGISLYQPEFESFQNFLSPATSDLPLGYHRVNAILNCGQNAIYASSETGYVFRFDETEQTFNPLNHENLGLIKSMATGTEGTLWVGTENAIHSLDTTTGIATAYTKGFSSPDGITNNYVTSISQTGENELWLGTTNRGVLRFHTNGDVSQPAPLQQTNDEFVNQVTADATGRIWIASNGGIRIYDPATNTLVKHSPQSLDSPNIPPSGINTMWADHQGNLWVGSNYDGLAVSIRFKPFQSLALHKTRPELPPHSPTTGFLEDKDGNLWVGHKSEGITLYPENGDTPRIFRPDQSDPHAISDKPILRIFQDSRERIWIGTYRDGLYLYRPETQDFSRILHDPNDPYSISGHDIRDIAEDSSGNLWFALHETGISRLDPATNRFTHYRKSEADEYGVQIKNDWINALLVDSQDRLWIGSPVGLTRIAADRKSAKHYKSEPSQLHTLSNPLVYDIYEDSAGRIWIATADGLNRYNPETESFSHYGTEVGFPHKSISSLVEDRSGFIWAGTLDGLAKFDPVNHTATSYRTSDGLVGNDFFENAAISTQDGTLYFGQSRGLTYFDPSKIEDNTTPPNVFITGIRLFNVPLTISSRDPQSPSLDKSLLSTSVLEFKHTQNAITFEYIAIDYLDPNQNHYAYMLEGQDSDWTHTQSQSEATYTNLRPGNYTFKVKATNSDGFWNETGDSIHILIQPPIWGTLWFRLLAAVAIISLPVLFYLARVSSIKREARRLERAVDQRTKDLRQANDQLNRANRQILQHGEELERTVKLRTKELQIAKSKAEHSDRLKSAFLANMSHEIRTPMNAIVGFLHILESKEISDEERSQYGSIIRKSTESLMRLIDDILDLSKIEAGQAEISPKPTNVEAICEELGALFRETLSSQKKGEVAYRHFAEIPEEFESVSALSFYIDPHRLKQILWNLLSNALKFTDAGEVALGYKIYRCTDNNESYQIKFTVRDTGIGIPKDQHKNVFNRFHKLNADQKKLHRGTGLGLAITLTLTELMGGKIELESEPQQGTTFYVTFPFDPVMKNSANLPASPRNDTSPPLLETDFSGCKILLVEDEQPNHDYINRALSKTGASVQWARSGREALELYRKGSFDLVLLDLKIPEIDGYEVARKIREQDQQIPIIAQSAYAMSSDHRRSIEAGANEHLVKPFRPQQLIETLERHLHPKN